MNISTEIFGKKVRKPSDITDDVEFEYYALDLVEGKANDFILEQGLKSEDIKAYKVKLRRSFEKIKRKIRGGSSVIDNVEFIYARIYISYITE